MTKNKKKTVQDRYQHDFTPAAAVTAYGMFLRFFMIQNLPGMYQVRGTFRSLKKTNATTIIPIYILSINNNCFALAVTVTAAFWHLIFGLFSGGYLHRV